MHGTWCRTCGCEHCPYCKKSNCKRTTNGLNECFDCLKKISPLRNATKQIAELEEELQQKKADLQQKKAWLVRIREDLRIAFGCDCIFLGQTCQCSSQPCDNPYPYKVCRTGTKIGGAYASQAEAEAECERNNTRYGQGSYEVVKR